MIVAYIWKFTARESMTDMNATKTETLKTYVGDVHALVTHGLKALEQQVDNLSDVGHKDALPAVREGKRILEQQKFALETRLNALGGSATAPRKDIVASVAGIAAGLMTAVRPSETVKFLRDDATFFSSLGVAYLRLYTTATSLGDADTSHLAQHGYEDTARMVMHLDMILAKVTIEGLRAKKLEVADVTESVKTMVDKTWDRTQAAST
jgi:hypothetical protein